MNIPTTCDFPGFGVRFNRTTPYRFGGFSFYCHLLSTIPAPIRGNVTRAHQTPRAAIRRRRPDSITIYGTNWIMCPTDGFRSPRFCFQLISKTRAAVGATCDGSALKVSVGPLLPTFCLQMPRKRPKSPKGAPGRNSNGVRRVVWQSLKSSAGKIFRQKRNNNYRAYDVWRNFTCDYVTLGKTKLFRYFNRAMQWKTLNKYILID